MRLTGVPANEILFVDDRIDNIEGARAAGWNGHPLRRCRWLAANHGGLVVMSNANPTRPAPTIETWKSPGRRSSISERRASEWRLPRSIPRETFVRSKTLAQAVSLGKDTFTQRRIRRASIEECVRVLKSYRKLLQEYGITRPEQMRVVATSAVREAMNRLAFIDRVYIATGLEIEPLDEAEVNRITYMGIQPLLQADPKLSSSKTVVAEIGSGSTEILMVRGGNVLFSNTYRLGSLRLLETLDKFDAPRAKLRTIMDSQIHRFIDQIYEQLDPQGNVEMIAIGGDMRFAAANLLEHWENNSLAEMPVAHLASFTRQLLQWSEDEIVHRFGISFPDAETVGPALLSYVRLAEKLQCQTIRVADTNLRDGLLSDLAIRDAWTAEFRNQIIRSAINLGRKYSFDETHAAMWLRSAVNYSPIFRKNINWISAWS